MKTLESANLTILLVGATCFPWNRNRTLAGMSEALFSIENFSVDFGPQRVLNQVQLTIKKGQTMALVGESGSGKSMTALALMGLLPEQAKVSGQIRYHDGSQYQEWLNQGEENFQRHRGQVVSMIFQEPMTSLNPVITCGEQVLEQLMIHQKISPKAGKKQVLHWFEKVKLPDPEKAFKSYPHQLSGGQRQRIMIAMALCCEPELLIADEPTTALDVTVQKEILDLIGKLQAELGIAVLFISHDLAVVQAIAHEVLVLRKGEPMEFGAASAIVQNPQNPYTQGLLKSIPKLDEKVDRLFSMEPIAVDLPKNASTPLMDKPLVEVENLGLSYPMKQSAWGRTTAFYQAVRDVSFQLFPGETLGLIGESGSGKSSIARCLIGLEKPQQGSIRFMGKDMAQFDKKDWKAFRKEVQFIFQDPYSALNPKLSVGEILREVLAWHFSMKGQAAKNKAIELLEMVGLGEEHYSRYPHAFSGGQRQRIGIARALAVEPKVIVCDESVSALDVSVQAQVLNLLSDLKEAFGLSYLFISHDMAVVKHMSDRLMVLNKGQVEDYGPADAIFEQAQSSFTQKLIQAIPRH